MIHSCVIAAALSCSMTCAAFSAAPVAVSGVCFIEYMSLSAGRFHAPKATTCVHPMRHWFEMRRINARVVSTEMIQLQARRNGSTEQFPRHSVGVVLTPTEAHFSVAHTVRGTHPLPAGMKGDQFNLPPEALTNGGIGVRHKDSASLASEHRGRDCGPGGTIPTGSPYLLYHRDGGHFELRLEPLTVTT